MLLAGLVGVLLGRQQGASSMESVDASLRRDATMLAELARPYLLDDSRSGVLQDVMATLRLDDDDTRLTVIRPDGAAVADTHQAPEQMESHADRTEVVEARQVGVGHARRFSRTVGVEQVYLAVVIRADGEVLGYARSSVSLSAVEAAISRARRGVALAASIAAVVALLGGYIFARRITGPIRTMTQAALAVTHGDYTQRLYAPSTDEIGSLAQAFNRMTGTLRDHLAEIEENHNKILAILSSMKEGVIAVDAAENVVHMNDAAAAIVGVEVHDCLDRPHWEAIRLKEVCDTLSKTIQSGTSLEGELRLAGGLSDRVVELQSSVLLDSDGHRSGAVVVLHDTSELRRLEGVRRDFVSNVSHELKTPVAAIRGLVETILDDPQMTTATRERFLHRANEQCGRLTLLVTDLLSLAAAEEKLGGPERTALDLTPFLRQSVAAHVPAGEERALTLEASLPSVPIAVLGDDESLRLIVDNLVSNAIRYTPEGGRIWVRLRDEGEHALIEVEDTGIGIDPLHQDRIFERFYRVDKARSRELGGTGLGLAIVKHLVLSMGGEISIRSELAKGTCFTVRFPLFVGEDEAHSS